MDSIAGDFIAAAEGRPVIFDVSSIPSWMVNNAVPDAVPENADEQTLAYGTKSNFIDFDSTVRKFAAYQARVAHRYMKGGFRDEYGRWHPSGHHYNNIAY